MRRESMRTAAKRRSTVAGQGPEPNSDSSCLESALHNFLSTVPEGLARCRRNILPTVEGSPSEQASQTVPMVGKAKTVPHMSQESPEKKQPKLHRKDQQTEKLENKEEAEKMHEMTRRILCYQRSKSSHDCGTPRRLERQQENPATPSTPRPRTRDFFFANNGDVGSPWTILSPFTCSQNNDPQQRKTCQRRLSSTSCEDDVDDEVWENDEAKCSNQDNVTSPSGVSSSFPKSLRQRALLRAPVFRSVSVDETGRSLATGFRLGGLFQKGISQRSFSSGSRTENMRDEGSGVCSVSGSNTEARAEEQVNSSGFISFFRRIGGRSKPGDVEEQSFK